MEVSLVETQASEGENGGLQVNKGENDRHGGVLLRLSGANAKNEKRDDKI